MTTTNLSLSVTIDNDNPETISDAFADLTLMAKGYIRSSAGVFVSVYNATDPDPDPSDDDLGRIAYDTHNSSLVDAGLTDGESDDDFDDLPPDHRNAWIQAALAVRKA